jgi:hypothetical protein
VVIVVLLWDYCGHCCCESTAVALRVLLWSLWSSCGHCGATVLWWHCGRPVVIVDYCGNCGGTVIIVVPLWSYCGRTVVAKTLHLKNKRKA